MTPKRFQDGLKHQQIVTTCIQLPNPTIFKIKYSINQLKFNQISPKQIFFTISFFIIKMLNKFEASKHTDSNKELGNYAQSEARNEQRARWT